MYDMIKKLFILSAMMLACSGCQSIRQVYEPETYQIPFMKIYPYIEGEGFMYSGVKLKFIAEFVGSDGKLEPHISEIFPRDFFGKLQFDMIAYEPVYRFMPKSYLELKRIVIQEMDFKDMPFPDAINWISLEIKKNDPRGIGVPIILRANSEVREEWNKIKINYKAKNITAYDLLEKLSDISGIPCRCEGNFYIESDTFPQGEKIVNAAYQINRKTSRSLFDGRILPRGEKIKGIPDNLSDIIEKNIFIWSSGEITFNIRRDKEIIKQLDWIFDVKYIPCPELPESELDMKKSEAKFWGTLENRKKLSDISIDHIEFEDLKVTDCISFLIKRSKELAPDKKGVEIKSIINGEVPKLTMLVDDITLGDAIRYICRAANLKYRILKDKVSIASQDVALDPIVEKIYPVFNMDVIAVLGKDLGYLNDIEEFMKALGVCFVTGSGISYDKEKKLLIVKQTLDEFRKIDELLVEICGYRTQFIYEKNAQLSAKVASLYFEDCVEVKGEMQMKEAKINGYPFPLPCFLIKDINVIKNPVLPKLRKYEPAR
ncbi:MAG TPA: hypothetical protein DCZ94_06055 [Lentisphaeria bacterium]|nr:hypothetical protein [Lentisphaeria bacterium]